MLSNNTVTHPIKFDHILYLEQILIIWTYGTDLVLLSQLPRSLQLGKCTMTLELRNLSALKIDSVFQAIKARAAGIASSSQMTISFKHLNVAIQPALTTKSVQATIIAAAQQLGLSYRPMQSGAGHDSQEMSRIAPVGMIFIPSVNGISHSPKEFSTAPDMANGANVLLQAVLQLDKQ